MKQVSRLAWCVWLYNSNPLILGMVSDIDELRDDVRQYWFQKYSRSGGAELCSSGFEHVFQVRPSSTAESSQSCRLL